jgi:hypothetical protein
MSDDPERHGVRAELHDRFGTGGDALSVGCASLALFGFRHVPNVL